MTLLVLIAALAASALAAAPASARSVPNGFFGAMYDNLPSRAEQPIQERHFDLMARSGVESVRTLFVWASLQPQEGVAPDFAETDVIVAQAALRRMDVLPVVLYAPAWARLRARDNLSPPRDYDDYAQFLRAAIRRYGPSGSFWDENPAVPKRPIRNWQIWNEAHLPQLWNVRPFTPKGWPQGYGAMLKVADRAIEQEDPGARTVLGGITGVAWLHMRHLYRVPGVGRAFDVMALHAYPQTEERVVKAIRLTRNAMRRARDGGKPIWLTEVAFPAAKGKAPPIDRQKQERPSGMARRLRALYALLAKERRKLALQRVYWYAWSSTYRGRGSVFDYAGLVASPRAEVIRPQPALRAYSASARRLQGCAKTSRGACR